MPVLNLKHVLKSFGPQKLLDDVSLTVRRGARMGLIGRNGEGKSTLLRIMAGLIEPDAGEVTRRSGARVAYLEQAPALPAGRRVFDVVAEGLGEVAGRLREHQRAVEALAQADDAAMPAALARVDRLQAELERMGAWQLQSRIETAVSRLSLRADQDVGELSGGWARRVALARAVVAQPEVLLLDEPTNHLDIASIEWLEDFVAGFDGAVVFVTHDRYFLDAVAEEIVELDRGRLHHFAGSWAEYLDRKAEMLAVEERQNRRFDRLLANEERWIRKGIPARRRRDEGRVRALEELRRQRAARRMRGGDVRLRVAAGVKPGRMMIEAVGLRHRMGETVVVEGFSHRIMSGERIALIGPNGAGKTTLLRLLLGELTPDAGRVRHGVRLAPAYLAQMRSLDPDLRLRDVLLPQGGNYVHIAGHEPRHVVSYLEDFLFDRERLNARVAALSGGERGRLMLARLLLEPANLLVLDEPTNDLDIGTLAVLEKALAAFPGTVLLVSHDRAFVDRVASRVLAFEGEGRIVPIEGGYSDWLAWKARRDAERAQAARASKGAAKPAARPKPAARRVKLSYHEQRELETLPERLEALEAEKAGIEEAFCDPDWFRRDPEGYRRAQARLAELEREIAAGWARWEALEAGAGQAPLDAESGRS